MKLKLPCLKFGLNTQCKMLSLSLCEGRWSVVVFVQIAEVCTHERKTQEREKERERGGWGVGGWEGLLVSYMSERERSRDSHAEP